MRENDDDLDILDGAVDALEAAGVILPGSGGQGYEPFTMTGISVDVILADGRNASLMLVPH